MPASGIYVTTVQLASEAASEPIVSDAGEARLVLNGNKLCASENGGPYVWIKAVDYVNLGDPRFGVVGDGVADDTAAVALAIQATVNTNASSKKRVLVLPSGEFRVGGVVVDACLGFTLVGDGKWSSQFIVDPYVPSGHGLCINSSQHVTLEGFALKGRAGNPAGAMVMFDYEPVTHAAYAIKLSDLWLTGDGPEAYDYGVYWSPNYGNNSEVGYWGLQIDRFKEAGVLLPGSQQKAHCFYNVNLNGHWDGIAPDSCGGKVGIRVGGGPYGEGGSFQMYGGGVGACRQAAFSIEYPNDPITISGVQSEACYRFVDMGEAALGNASIVRVVGCRIDSVAPIDPNGVVKFAGEGPFVCESNEFYAPGGILPKVRLAASGDLTSLRLVGNKFKTPGSINESPLVQGGSGHATVEMHSNIFRDAFGCVARRDETLDINPSDSLAGAPGVYLNWRRGRKFYYCPYTAFTADGPTSSVVALMLPKGTKIHDLYVHIPQAFAHPCASVTFSVGKTPGGSEYIREQSAQTAGAWYGDAKSQCGPALDGSTTQSGHVPDGNATSPIYVTVRVSQGATVGDGSRTHLLAGDLRLVMDLEVLPRTPVSGRSADCLGG